MYELDGNVALELKSSVIKHQREGSEQEKCHCPDVNGGLDSCAPAKRKFTVFILLYYCSFTYKHTLNS